MNSIEFKVKSEMFGVTDLVVDIPRFVSGLRTFSCGSGEDVKLDKEQEKTVWEYIYKQEPKTMESWHEEACKSGDNCYSWDCYVKVGDVVSEDVVENFRNCLPPVWDSSNLMQMGEAYSHRRDPEKDGACRATYLTFAKIDCDIWLYVGHCFRGEMKNIT